MAILVPLVLVGLALAVMFIVSMFANRKKRRGGGQSAADQTRILIHAINDDRCTGCDACVAVCPTNVLDLISNKSRVLRFQDCIQCEACMWACPTEALVMFPEGTNPPPVRVPDIDGNYETVVQGQYLIGEVAGKPLVKNAANLGRAAVEHILQSGLRPNSGGNGGVDVVIVGSGPGGMSAALSCVQRGLSYLILEKENTISSTVSRYPKGKLVMAEPYETANLSLLPIFDSTKEDMVALWKELASTVKLSIKMHETVQVVQKQPDGTFMTTTTAGQYHSQRVILATGTRGKPRTLGAPGEHLPKVESLLEDPGEHRGKAVCVVGGGDSALEAAIALSEAGAKVIIAYRGRSFHRAQAKNRQRIDKTAAEGRIKIKMQSEVVEFAEETVTLQMSDGTQKRYPNHAAFVLIGADPPIQWLSTLGINYVERPHMQPMPASDAMVRQLVPGARDCPENADDAASQVFGRPIKTKPKNKASREHTDLSRSSVSRSGIERSERPAGVGRRFVRSASSLFRMREDNNQRPIPLAEFVGGGRVEFDEISSPGGSKRDQLEPGERTRILRMLRDEGGRQADEDSKVYRINNILEGESASRQSKPPPPPAAGKRSRRGNPALLATLPPPVAGAETQGGAPREALIVGLAKASADAPGRRRRQRPVPVVHEEHTQHLSAEEARALNKQAAGPAAKPSPPRRKKPSRPEPVMEEPTSLAHFDPAQMMREAERARAPKFSRNETDSEDATRDVDVDSLLADEMEFMPVANRQDPPTLTGEGIEDGGKDDDFASRSMSEIEWDLD